MALNQLKAGAILSYVSIGLSNLVGLIYLPFMLRMLGQSEFGLYSLVASVVAYLTILDFGFGNAIVRYTARYRAQGQLVEQYSLFGMFLALYTLIGIIAFISGFELYLNIDLLFGKTMTFNELARGRTMMLLLCINLSLTFPLSIFGSIITAYENFVFPKLVNIIRIVINPLIVIPLLLYGYKAIAMVVVITLLNIITLLINCWFCFAKLKIKLVFNRFDRNLLKEITRYSFYIFLGIIVDKIYWGTGQFVLGIVTGTTAVAIFAIAIQLNTFYMSFSTAISGVFLPRITTMVTQKKSDKEISDMFIKTGRIQYIVMGYILCGFIIFGKAFILLWAGREYALAYPITLILIIPFTIPLIQNLGVTILQARNQMKFRSLLYIVIATLSLGVQIPLSKTLGGIGCAIGVAAAMIIGQILIMNIYYKRIQKINIIEFWKEICKMSFVPVIMGILTNFLLTNILLDSILKLGIGILLFSIVYIPVYWLTSMNQYEKDLIGKPFITLVYKRIYQ